MKYFKKIVGDRIYLSPRGSEDAEKFTEWMNDFDVTDYTARSEQVITLEEERKYLEENSNKQIVFSIITLDGDKLIGTVSLENMKTTHRSAILGIFIGDKEYREKGYGTEAVKLILDYGFNYINLHSIKLEVLDCNARAIKCYKKCGFKEVGKSREDRFINGKWHGTISMDILENEFTESFIRNKNI